MSARQITSAPHGHVLTNVGVWSPDARWIVYDVRSAADGGVFDGTRIERVEVETGRVEVLHESRDGACCGVATCSPVDDRVVFIAGPERPTPDWSYGPAHRQGVVVHAGRAGPAERLDARDLVAPFTPGALRGGSHVHVFSPDAALVSFTYEDAVLDDRKPSGAEANRRGVAVSLCGRPVRVPRSHPRNHDGSGFSVMVTALTDEPRPGSDQIGRAIEEAWVGRAGYRRTDGGWQRRALAFQGEVVLADGRRAMEVFVVDLPDDADAFTTAGADPLAGTATRRPRPPRGVVQRRLTFTADRSHPGLQGPRHWLRSSPDGTRIGFLMRDDEGVVRLFTVSPAGGEPEPISRGPHAIDSAFTWSPCGRWIACVIDGSVSVVAVSNGAVQRLTPRMPTKGPRPEACVFSPDGRRIAYCREVAAGDGRDWNQVFVVDVPM